MSAPYAKGDRVTMRSVPYTVQGCYAVEDGGWWLRLFDDAGHSRWVDSDDVKPMRAAVVETEAQKEIEL